MRMCTPAEFCAFTTAFVSSHAYHVSSLVPHVAGPGQRVRLSDNNGPVYGSVFRALGFIREATDQAADNDFLKVRVVPCSIGRVECATTSGFKSAASPGGLNELLFMRGVCGVACGAPMRRLSCVVSCWLHVPALVRYVV